MRHPRALEWEAKLKAIFDRIDAELEERYGRLYPLHPARAARGETADPEADGLFDVGAAFSAGFGSQFGAGYVIQIRLATLEEVPEHVRESIRQEVKQMLEAALPEVFPGRKLQVVAEGEIFKIVGDLGLGEA
ncbi:MAG: hypothetical protein N3A66_00675 [Planctomycetota bacterium]|nr:hypothetical protein [Planctomycetota bacterium]